MLRKYAAGAAFAAALVIGLTACSAEKATTEKAVDKAKPVASKAPTPAELLTAAVTKTRAVNVKIEISDGSAAAAKGGYDATTHVGAFSTESDGEKIDMVSTDTEVFLSGPGANGKSVRMEVGKIKPESGFVVLVDPVAGLSLLTGATTVESSSVGFFSGTIDLAKVQATAPATQKFLEGATKAAAAKASAINFTAKTNPEGYLTEIDTVLPSMQRGHGRALHAEDE